MDARLLNNRVERRLWIWLYGHDLVEVGTKKPFWACSLCDAKNKSNGIYSAQSISVLRGIYKHIHFYGGGLKKQTSNKPVITAGAQPFTMDRGGCRGIRTSSNSSIQINSDRTSSRLAQISTD